MEEACLLSNIWAWPMSIWVVYLHTCGPKILDACLFNWWAWPILRVSICPINRSKSIRKCKISRHAQFWVRVSIFRVSIFLRPKNIAHSSAQNIFILPFALPKIMRVSIFAPKLSSLCPILRTKLLILRFQSSVRIPGRLCLPSILTSLEIYDLVSRTKIVPT